MINQETYKNYTILIHLDESPMNPWEDWDCEIPVLVYSGDRMDRGITAYGDIDTGIPEIPEAIARKHWKELLALCGFDGSSMLQNMRDYLYSQNYNGYSFVETIRDSLEDYFDRGIRRADQLEFLASIYDLLGVPNYLTTSTGYCQSDWAELLVVATPEVQKRYGLKDDLVSDDLKPTAKLWGQWAWGDVYGFEVLSPEGESMDSCWSYYGDPEESGLMADAKSAIDRLPEITDPQFDPTRIPVGNRYGAPMGRRDSTPNLLADPGDEVRLFLVVLQEGYDLGGAYWGSGANTPPLWCAVDQENDYQFVRAWSKEAAAKTLNIPLACLA